jgi:hypothetical protein
MNPVIKQDEYRQFALLCLELANTTASLADRAHLPTMAEAWFDLAERAAPGHCPQRPPAGQKDPRRDQLDLSGLDGKTPSALSNRQKSEALPLPAGGLVLFQWPVIDDEERVCTTSPALHARREGRSKPRRHCGRFVVVSGGRLCHFERSRCHDRPDRGEFRGAR